MRLNDVRGHAARRAVPRHLHEVNDIDRCPIFSRPFWSINSVSMQNAVEQQLRQLSSVDWLQRYC